MLFVFWMKGILQWGDVLVLWGFSRGGLIFGETYVGPMCIQFLLSLRDEILGGNVPKNVKR
jgi:hypothetical protein